MEDLKQITDKLGMVLQNQRRQSLADLKWLDMDQLAQYLNISKDTVYALNKEDAITRYYPNGKKAYVKREEVDAWVELAGVVKLSKYEKNKKLKRAA